MAAKKEEKIDMKFNLSMYWNFLRKYKPVFALILAIVLMVEATSVAEKYLFKAVIDRGTEFAAGELARAGFLSALSFVGLAFLCLIGIKSAGKWGENHFVNKLEAGIIADLKRKFFNHLITLSAKFHTSNKTGSLISKIARGGNAVERMSDVVIYNVAPLIFQLIVVGGSLVYLSWVPAVVVVITVIVFTLYSLVIQKSSQKANLIANNSEDREKANISDVFTNIDSIKYFGKEQTVKRKFFKFSEITKITFLKAGNYFRWLDAGQGVILGLGTFFLLYFPLMQFLNGQITIGTIVFIYGVYGSLLGPMLSFVHGIRNYYRAMAEFDALFRYAKVENDIEDKPNAKELKIKEGKIEFRNVSFAYRNKNIISNLNLSINKNEKVALVGHSGCGKSTLIKLLYRLYDIDSGKILIDDKDITDFKQESLRSELSIVPQECVLFDDTIYNNIKFSKQNATREEVLAAIKFAQLDKIIKSFPKQENTIVGERGVKLSGGEKQRVSIARALLANKKILVLDEATSSLDSKTEYEIQQSLAKLLENRTAIIIAHRLSTIMRADKIVVIDKGRILQFGKHRDLIREPGQYQKLWNLQKGGYIK